MARLGWRRLERRRRENVYGTDPTNRDTDGDGFTDGEEAEAGSDPLDPLSTPLNLLPPDPSKIAPAADSTPSASLHQRIAFLGEGEPI